jgi:hypothetical protein
MLPLPLPLGRSLGCPVCVHQTTGEGEQPREELLSLSEVEERPERHRRHANDDRPDLDEWFQAQRQA